MRKMGPGVLIEQQIYTSSEKGHGDTGGLQVKARSKGITDNISQALLPYCNHYHVVEYLYQLERRYYRGQKSGSGVQLKTLLERFPPVTTYHHVKHDLYGLTRVRYLGRDHSGRAGNFLAHSLVFPVDVLAELDWNPLAVEVSPLFEIELADDDLDLASPDSLEITQPPLAGDEWLAELADHAAIYPQLVDAVARQFDDKPENRPGPVIICCVDWEHARAAIRTLLQLLPPALRCRTTFTTYEPDPYAVLPKGQTDQSTLKIIATLSPADGGVFGFRPDELARYQVWDFTRGKANSSQFKPASAYGQTMVSLAQTRGADTLTDMLTFLTQLGAGEKMTYWPSLIRAYDQRDELLTPNILAILKKTALTPDQAADTLSLLAEALGDAVIGTETALGDPLIQTAQTLYKRLSAGSAQQQRALDALSAITAQALVAGQWSQAQALSTIDPTQQPILSAAAKLFVQYGGLQFRPDTRQSLAVLEPLAAELADSGWLITEVWQAIVKLIDTSAETGLLNAVLTTFAALYKQLDAEDALTATITEQATSLIPLLLVQRCPQGALTLLSLLADDPAPALLADLADRRWPPPVPDAPPSPEDQAALTKLLTDALNSAPLDTPDNVLGALRCANAYGVIQPVWDGMPGEIAFLARGDVDEALLFFEDVYDIASLPDEALVVRLAEFAQRFEHNEPQLRRIFSLAHDLDLLPVLWDQVADWPVLQERVTDPDSQLGNDLLELLAESQHDQAVFDVLMIRFNADPTEDQPAWETRVDRLLPHLLATGAAAGNLDRLLKMMSAQLPMIAVAEMSTALLDQVDEDLYGVIMRHSRFYRHGLRGKPRWQSLLQLLQHGDAGAVELADEFWREMIPEINRPATLDDWSRNMLNSSARVQMMSQQLVPLAVAHPEFSDDIVASYLTHFANRYPQACEALVLQMGEADIQTLYDRWRVAFAQITPSADADPVPANRLRLVQSVKRIENSHESPIPTQAVPQLDNWYSVREQVSAEDWQWSTEKINHVLETLNLQGWSIGQYMAPLVGVFIKQTEEQVIDFLLDLVDDRPEYLITQLLFISENSLMENKDELGWDTGVNIIKGVLPHLTDEQQAQYTDWLRKWLAGVADSKCHQNFGAFIHEVQSSGGGPLRRLFRRSGQRH